MDQEIQMAAETIRDPASIPLVTYAWVFLLTFLGCVVRVLRELYVNKRKFSTIMMMFIVEMFTSGFAGLLTFFLCEAMRIDRMYAAVWIGIAAWMGVRALNALESLYKARLVMLPKGGDDAKEH